MRIKVVPGSRPRRPCTPSRTRWRRGRRVLSSTSTRRRTASWWCATTPPSTAPRPGTAPFRRSRWPSSGRWTSPTGGSPGPTSRPGRPDADYPFRGRAPADPSFGIATLREVLERFPGVVLNLDIKQTAPVVAPYEESLARLLAEFGRMDDVIVASFLDPATDAFRGFAPSVPTSAGTMATAEAWRAVQAGEDVPDSPAVAYQVPERQGDLVVVDERFVGRGPPGGQGRARVDGQRRRLDGAPARPRRGRDHLGRAHHAVRRAGRTGSRLGGAVSPPAGMPGALMAAVSRGRSSASCRGWPSSSS